MVSICSFLHGSNPRYFRKLRAKRAQTNALHSPSNLTIIYLKNNHFLESIHLFCSFGVLLYQVVRKIPNTGLKFNLVDLVACAV